jgi:hypothetical protein
MDFSEPLEIENHGFSSKLNRTEKPEQDFIHEYSSFYSLHIDCSLARWKNIFLHIFLPIQFDHKIHTNIEY